MHSAKKFQLLWISSPDSLSVIVPQDLDLTQWSKWKIKGGGTVHSSWTPSLRL